MYAKGLAPRCDGASRRGEMGWAKGTEKVNKGARGMPVALGGDEGRDKLRKAAVRANAL